MGSTTEGKERVQFQEAPNVKQKQVDNVTEAGNYKYQRSVHNCEKSLV